MLKENYDIGIFLMSNDLRLRMIENNIKVDFISFSQYEHIFMFVTKQTQNAFEIIESKGLIPFELSSFAHNFVKLIISSRVWITAVLNFNKFW